MTTLHAIILGIIQGISEFLPISSDGHLTLFEHILDFKGENLVFNVTLHIGTLLAIIVFYFKDLLKMIHWKFISLGFVSSVPTAIIGLIIQKNFDFNNVSMPALAAYFSISGLALFIANKKMKVVAPHPMNVELIVEQISYKKAFIIGVAQGLAVLPGVSRSGSTIATSLIMGITAPVAAFYSFAICIPAVIGACILELRDAQIDPNEMNLYIMGVLISFVVGLGALNFLRFIISKKTSLLYFAYYLWALSVLILFF